MEEPKPVETINTDGPITSEVPTEPKTEPANAEPIVPVFCTISNVGYASDRNAQHRRVMEVMRCFTKFLYWVSSFRTRTVSLIDWKTTSRWAFLAFTMVMVERLLLCIAKMLFIRYGTSICCAYSQEFFKLLEGFGDFENEEKMRAIFQTCYTNIDEQIKVRVGLSPLILLQRNLFLQLVPVWSLL